MCFAVVLPAFDEDLFEGAAAVAGSRKRRPSVKMWRHWKRVVSGMDCMETPPLGCYR